MKQLHNLQLRILKKLLFAQELRYTDLKPNSRMENNQFNFHLDQLIDKGFVHKGTRLYSLTNKGKEYANRMDTELTRIMQQSKITTSICCVRKKGDSKYYLIYTRLKQPFYGCQGFPSGKVKFGEKVTNAARRELKEETGLNGKPEIVSIKHFLVIDKRSKKLLEDMFLFLCLVKNPLGKLRGNKEGKYKWVKETKLRQYVTNHFEDYASFKKYLNEIKNHKGQITLEEIVHESSKF